MRTRSRDSILLLGATVGLLLVPALASGQAGSDDIPRLANGRPDFNGIWDKPRVGNITADGRVCGAASEGCVQEGTGELPYTDWGLEQWEGYRNDWTAYCLPWGYTRAWQTSYPVEIFQTPNRMAILFESNNIFHVIRMDEEHPEDLEPTWLGHSVATWEGDTLVVDTIGFNGKTYLDTAEHPMSEEMRMIERIRFIDRDHLSYQVTWDDPKTYTEPIHNNRIMVRMPPGSELFEYWCMENNKNLFEGRLPPLVLDED